jgi:electron transport complex protein RnfD
MSKEASKTPTGAQKASVSDTGAGAATKAVKPFDPPFLHLSASPHIRSSRTVPKLMLVVTAALMPAFVSSIIFFGVRAAMLAAVCVAAAVVAECAANLVLRRGQTAGDFSAVVTGLLVAFNLPSGLPLWMAALGSVFAIVVAKMVFGGLGCNFINPAIAGRAFLVASYPAQMTSYPPTLFGSVNGLVDTVSAATASSTAGGAASAIDAVSSATPLAVIKHVFAAGAYKAGDFTPALKDIFLGNVGGCIGETSALALLIGGIFLMSVRVIDFRIPFAYIFTVFALFWLANGTGTFFTVDSLVAPTFHILAGGLFLGAFFMATDPVTSPITPLGRLLFGAGCGALTFIIRKYGGYPEGVSFSILLMNLVVPLIDRCTRPKIYGGGKEA